MKKLFELLADILQQNQPAMLATVVSSRGSAPGGLGASMLVDSIGRRIGTVGGGAVEYQAEQLALTVLREGRSATEDYTLRHGSAKDIGMVCGGEVTVNFCYIAPIPHAVDFAHRAAACFDANENTWLLLELAQNGCHLALYTQGGALDVFGPPRQVPFGWPFGR